MIGTSKSIWGFDPRSIPGCTLWLDGADNASMNSTSAVTIWNDKSGQSNTMAGTGTWSGGTMVFNGTTNAFSNTLYAFPFGAYSMFAVYSNTTAPAANAYMNAVYGSNGFPMLGTFGPSRFVSARSVVANTGALTGTRQGWAARVASTGTAIGYGVATDSSGNVIVTGAFGPGGGVLTVFDSSGVSNAGFSSISQNDVFIAKYTSTGAVSWAARIGGAGSDTGNGIATDSSGNMFVTGLYGGGGSTLTLYNTNGTIGGTLAVSSGTSDVFIARYTSAGAVSWGARIASTGADVGTAVATDPSGNVFVTGYYDAALTLFNSSGVSNASLPITGGTDGFIAKYSSAGAVLWAARIAGTGTANDRVNGIATDSSGSAFVTGIYTATLTLFNSSGVSNASLPFAGGVDCFVAKYTSDGAVSWAAQITGGTTSSDYGYGIATDSSGNVFVTGQYGIGVTLWNADGSNGATLASTATNDVFVAKYSSTGSVLWAARIAGSGADTGAAIATDSSGNVLVTGFHGAALDLYNSNGTVGASIGWNGSVDAFAAKYSADGAVLWGVQIVGSSPSFDQGLAVAADSSGNIFVTGQYGALLDLRGVSGAVTATLPASGTSGVFLAKYTPDGYVASNAPTPASSNVLVSATYAPTTFSPFVNGFTQLTRPGSTLTTTGLFLGGPSNYFNGSISEVLIFGTTLTAPQRQSVEGYLSRKWGIGTRLIITHPFYTIEPFNRYFNPNDIPGCSLWLDAADNSTMNSTTTVTSWLDKSGSNNTMTGTATWTGSNMSFNGSTQAFSNTGYVFPNSAYSMFGVYSNTTAPAAGAYMNALYGFNGFPMLGTFGPSRFVSARSVVANTGALNVPVGWAARIAGATGLDAGTSVATDTLGNVFVTGYYMSSLNLANANGTTGATLTFTGGTDGFLAKYSSAGAVMWATRMTGATTSEDVGTGVATDTSGNVFVCGGYGTTLTLFNTGGGTGATLTSAGGFSDGFLAKYSSAGAVLWAARISSTDLDAAFTVATDSSDNVIVSGYYGAAVTLFNASGTAGASLTSNNTDVFIAKYSSAGVILWATRLSSTQAEYGRSVAVDTSGNVFVAGQYGSATITLYNTGGGIGATLTNSGNTDCFIVKYSSAGAVLWATRISSTSGDIGYGIAADSSGNVFVTGTYGAALTLFNTGGGIGASLTYEAGSASFVAKYSSVGAVLWATRITNALVGNGISTDLSDNLFVTGSSSTPIFYNSSGISNASLTTSGGDDAFIAKYTSAGGVSWVTRIGSTGADNGYGFDIDSSGNVFVTGTYGAALTLFNSDGTPGASLTYVGGNNDSFIAKYTPDGFVGASFPASSNVLVSATYAPTTFSPFVNGFNTYTLAGTTLATTGIFVGGPSNYFNGTISELLIYSANLTSNQRQQVEGYLINKWGLSAQTVAGHQYKLIPPTSVVPFQPIYISTPLIWFDAADTSTIVFSSGSVISTWSNKGSSRANATTRTGSLTSGVTTFNGLNIVNCPASANLGFTMAIPNQPRAWFAVFRLTSQLTTTGLTQYFAIVNQTTGSGQDAIAGPMAPTNIATNTYSIGEGPSGIAVNINTVTAPNGFNVMSQYGYINSAASTASNFVMVNGTAMTLNASLVASGYTTTSVLYVLGDTYGGSGADIAELMLFNTELTTPQRQQIEGYIGWKWGIARTLPTTHPFYKYPPALA